MLEVITEKGSQYYGINPFSAEIWFELLKEKAKFVILMKNGYVKQYYDAPSN